MSHGRIVTVDEPKIIKRSFGAGYNVYIEPKDTNISAQEQARLFARAKQIFLSDPNFQGICESRDSSDKKLIMVVPIEFTVTIATLLARVEEDLPQVQTDIELNSLEDAFVKIAEDEISAGEPARAHVEDTNQHAQEFNAYHSFEGNQKGGAIMRAIIGLRLQTFSRDKKNWIWLYMPLIYVITNLVIVYALIVTMIGDPFGDEVDKSDSLVLY